MSIQTTADADGLVARLLAGYLAPPPDLTVDAWADENRELPRATSSEPGQWRTDRAPYMRQIMQDLSESSRFEEVVLMFGTQLGKSEAGNNWLGYVIHVVPGPMMLIQPTVDLAKRYSKQRIAPMISACSVLRDRVKESRSRDSGNTTLLKEFPGGLLVITGANSASGLASMPARYIHADEVDDYPDDLDEQGAPLAIAMARQDTFANRKRLVTSSPKRPKGQSLIEARFEAGTRCRFHVACPHCGHYQRLEWGGTEGKHGLVYRNEDPETAVYVCCECGAAIPEHHKPAMLAGGVWIAEDPTARVRSYHLSSLYSPIGWVSWKKVCEEHREASLAAETGNPAPLKTWNNTRLALTVAEEGASLDSEWLRGRGAGRQLRTVPASCCVLTAGVDTQDNRLEVCVWAWGPGEESAIVDFVQIWGDPAQLERLPGGQPTVWERLDALFETRYPHASGNTLAVEAVGIDTGGHCTHAVYNYCRDRASQRVKAHGLMWVRKTYAIKGQERSGLPVKGKASLVDVNWAGRVLKAGVRLWHVGTTAAKDWWLAHLKVATPGPGYVHLATDLPDDWYSQMTAEKRRLIRTSRGLRFAWVCPTGTRNEAWDCSVYALFAAHTMDLHRFTAAMWQRLIDRVAPSQPDLLSAAAMVSPGVSEVTPAASSTLDPAPLQLAQATESPRPGRQRNDDGGFGRGDWDERL